MVAQEWVCGVGIVVEPLAEGQEQVEEQRERLETTKKMEAEGVEHAMSAESKQTPEMMEPAPSAAAQKTKAASNLERWVPVAEVGSAAAHAESTEEGDGRDLWSGLRIASRMVAPQT